MTKVNGIVFAQAQDSKKAVVANKYVAHALYEQNKAIIESLGGAIVKGVGGFRAEFKTAAKAKKFIAQAICEMSEKDYKATRKVAEDKPKSTGKGSKDAAKGNKKSTRKGKGDATPTKAVTDAKVKETSKPTTRKGKGNVELTEAGKKALDRMKTSVLNRAASAYSIANGGEATTFKALGKSTKELEAFVPKAKAALLKSDKWAKAVSAHGLTEDMLG